MDVLKDIVFPQSPTHILLLKYLLFLTLLILLPYLSVLLSTTLFSAMHFNKGKSTGNRDYLVFANELIDMFTANKVMSISLGLIPLLSIIFILGQLLLNSSLNVTSHLFFAFIILIFFGISGKCLSQTANLKVVVTHINETKGNIRIGVFDNALDFKLKKNPVAAAELPAKDSTVSKIDTVSQQKKDPVKDAAKNILGGLLGSKKKKDTTKTKKDTIN